MTQHRMTLGKMSHSLEKKLTDLRHKRLSVELLLYPRGAGSVNAQGILGIPKSEGGLGIPESSHSPTQGMVGRHGWCSDTICITL